MLESETASRPTVLVVEDDRAVGRILRMALERAGFAVAVVDTGGAALRLLEQGRMDGVVLDLGLPDELAPAVLAWLRQREPAVPWLVASAIDAVDAAQRYGPFNGHFIAKPFDPWQVVRQLEEMLPLRQ